MSQKTITINGRVYDAHTGMPIEDAAPDGHAPKTMSPKHKPLHPSSSIHQPLQKSHTLNRQVVRKHAPKLAAKPANTIRRSPAITKFAPHPSGSVAPARAVSDIGPLQHPAAVKAHQQLQQRSTLETVKKELKPSHILKQEAVKEAMQKAPNKAEAAHRARAEKPKKHFSRLASIGSVSLALLLLGGYFTYINMPNLSVRVAAAQAGVDASYPSYHPDGYSLKGPVAYSDGQVTMKFTANAGPQNYTVSEEKSNWDSSAVLDNYVKQKAGNNYITYDERGLTIYTFDGNAAWVNKGILYTISGDAPISSDQIRHIATSM